MTVFPYFFIFNYGQKTVICNQNIFGMIKIYKIIKTTPFIRNCQMVSFMKCWKICNLYVSQIQNHSNVLTK